MIAHWEPASGNDQLFEEWWSSLPIVTGVVMGIDCRLVRMQQEGVWFVKPVEREYARVLFMQTLKQKMKELHQQ